MVQESVEMGAQQDSPRMMEEVQEEVAVVANEATPSSPSMVEETQHQVEDTHPGPAQQQPEEQQMTSEDDTMTADSQSGDQEASQQRVGVTLGLDEEMALKLILHALEDKETPKFQMGLKAILQLKAAKQLQNYPLFCENVL